MKTNIKHIKKGSKRKRKKVDNIHNIKWKLWKTIFETKMKKIKKYFL